MYNLHCHTFLSDGELVASEVAVRYLAAGYKAIAITDHADYSNIKTAVEAVLEFTRHWPKDSGIRVLPGIELTHLPLEQFQPLTAYARAQGIQVVVGHGESPVEPVTKGTNRAAIEAGVDILAHPGHISDEDAILAKEKGVFLEITSRHGHANANAFVVMSGLRFGTKMILNTDGHAPLDIISPDHLKHVGITAGLSIADMAKIYQDVEAFISSK